MGFNIGNFYLLHVLINNKLKLISPATKLFHVKGQDKRSNQHHDVTFPDVF